MDRLVDYIKAGVSLDISIMKTTTPALYKIRINGESPFHITVRELLHLQNQFQEEEEDAEDAGEFEERGEATGSLFIVRAIARQIRRMGLLHLNAIGLAIEI